MAATLVERERPEALKEQLRQARNNSSGEKPSSKAVGTRALLRTV
jgi:hypothetical protein